MARFLPFLGQQRGPAKLRITGTPPALTVGEAFNFSYAIAGGVEPYDVTGSGTLPDGVTHDAATLTFSGTPTEAGDFNYDVNVADADDNTASRTFRLSVAEVVPDITLQELDWTPSGITIYQDTLEGAPIGTYSGLSVGGVLSLTGADFDAGRLAVEGNTVVVGAAGLAGVVSLVWTPVETNADADNSPRASTQRAVVVEPPQYFQLSDLTITPRSGPWTTATPLGTIVADVSGWHPTTVTGGRSVAGTEALALNSAGTALVVAGGWPEDPTTITGWGLTEDNAGASNSGYYTAGPDIPIAAAPAEFFLTGVPPAGVEGEPYPGWAGPTAHNSVGTVTYSLKAGSDDPADFGLTFDPATGGFEPSDNVIPGTFSAIIVGADDNGTAELAISIEVEAVEEDPEPEAFRLVGEFEDGWAGAPYGPEDLRPLMPGAEWRVENNVGEVTYEVILDAGTLEDYGLNLRSTGTSFFTPIATNALIAYNDGVLSGVVKATDDDTSEVVELPFLITIRPPLSIFGQNFASGSNVPTQYVQGFGSLLSESGHMVTVAGGVFVWNGTSESTYPKGISPSSFGGVMRIDGFTTPTGDQEAEWTASMRHLGASGTAILGVALRASAGFSHNSGTYYVGSYYSNADTGVYEFRIERRDGSGMTTLGTYTRQLQYGESPVRVKFLAEDDDVNETVNLTLIIDGVPQITTTDDALYGQNGVMGMVWRGGASGPNFNQRLMSLYAGALGEVESPQPGTTYFIDYENGDDSNDGLTELTAWKHGPQWPGSTARAAMFSPLPGDTYKFKGGVVYEGRISTMRGSHDPDQPVTYIGDDWGPKRAILTDSVDVFDDLRKPLNAEDANNCPFWEEDDFYILEHTGINARQFALVLDKTGHYKIAAAPKPFFLHEMEDVRVTAAAGGFFYHGVDLPNREWIDPIPGVLEEEKKMRITDPALAALLATSLPAAAAYYNAAANDLYRAYPLLEIEGDDVIFTQNQAGDSGYLGDNRFRMSFWNVNSMMEPGTVAVLGTGKLAVWLRPGATELRYVPYTTSGYSFSPRNNAYVEGFTVQGLAARATFDLQGKGRKIKRCFIADGYATYKPSTALLDATDSVDFGVENSTFRRLAGLYGVKLNHSKNPSVSRLSFAQCSGSQISDNGGWTAAGKGTENVTINEVIIQGEYTIHKNAITFYGNLTNSGFVDTANISNLLFNNVPRPMTALSGMLRNFYVDNVYLYATADAEAAFGRGASTADNQPNRTYLSDGVTENRNPPKHTMELSNAVIYGPVMGINASRNTKGLVFDNVMTHQFSFTEADTENAVPRKDWSRDALEPWQGVDDIRIPSNGGDTYTQYLTRPDLVLDDPYYGKFQLYDGTWVEIDLTDLPQDEGQD